MSEEENNVNGSRRKPQGTTQFEQINATSAPAMDRGKHCAHRAVTWDTPPTRVDNATLSLPGLGEIQLVANNPLPKADWLRAARVCVRRGTRSRRRLEVHLSVRVDVVPRTKRRRKVPLVAGAAMGCAETLTLHNAKTLTLPDHELELERSVTGQRRMSGCVKDSRKWREELDTLREGAPLLDPDQLPEVRAGTPIVAEDQPAPQRLDDFESFSGQFEGRPDYFLRVQGDSLNKVGFRTGDDVAVQRNPDVRDGDLVVARIGQEIVLKRYRRVSKRVVELQPESTNPEHQPIRIDAQSDDVEIVGV